MDWLGSQGELSSEQLASALLALALLKPMDGAEVRLAGGWWVGGVGELWVVGERRLGGVGVGRAKAGWVGGRGCGRGRPAAVHTALSNVHSSGQQADCGQDARHRPIALRPLANSADINLP